MGLLVLVWLVSLPALIALGVWLFRLATRPATRADARRRSLRTLIGLGLLALASVPCVVVTFIVYEFRTETAARHAATHHRLDAPARIGGIDLPAGTQLELRLPNDRESFQSATFPAVHTVYGVKTRRISRFVDTRLDADRPQVTVSIDAEDVTWIDGWHCQAGSGTLTRTVSVTVAADGASARLERCHAANGNAVDGFPIPPGSEIAAVTGRTAPSPGDARRWDIVLPRQAFFPVRGVPVYLARFQVDDAHHTTMLESAELACRLTLGTVTYAPGTEVGGRDEAGRARFPDAWVFQTDAARVATQDGAAVEAGAWIVQSLDGRLHEIVPARIAPGPFARFIMSDEPVPGPASPEVSCDEMMSSWPARATPSPASMTR